MKGLTVIGISGKIGAGKDEIAKYLAVHHGFKVIRFSDQLKEEVLKTLRLTLNEIWTTMHAVGYAEMEHDGWYAESHARYGEAIPSEEDLRWMLWQHKPPIIRRLLQEWGTELRRYEDPDYWVKKWKQAASQALDQGYSVVAPDQRFMNEIRAVHAWEPFIPGHNVLVERPGTAAGDHSSEHAWTSYAGWGWTFHNDGTIQALQFKVEDYLVSRLA